MFAVLFIVFVLFGFVLAITLLEDSELDTCLCEQCDCIAPTDWRGPCSLCELGVHTMGET